MSETKVILVTGVSNFWGRQVAARLIEIAENPESELFSAGVGDYSGIHIIGFDSIPPKDEIKGLDFIQADIRNPLFLDFIKSENVHTVCHMAFLEATRPSEANFDYNVIGTMKVFGACSEAEVKKVVLKSSTMVYGANPTNPAFITEQYPLQGNKTNGFVRDLAEIEAFCNGFVRQAPDLILTILRFPNVIGLTVNSPMTRFLKAPTSPVLLGFDPLMQVIHEKDAVESIVFAVINDVPGIFNVAAEGILPLDRVIKLGGKIPIPVFHPFAYLGTSLLKAVGTPDMFVMPFDWDYLRYPWVTDLAKMRNEFGYQPTYTAEEALREFAGQQRVKRYKPDSTSLEYDEERLKDTIERRRRMRERPLGNLEEEVDNE